MKNIKEMIYELVRSEALKHPDGRGVETAEVAAQLHLQRTNASALLNRLCDEGRLRKSTGRPVVYALPAAPDTTESSCFRSLIGYNGSLRSAVQLAKAAILYPQKSLSTVIIAERGSGTSSLANMMYEFAKEVGVLKAGAPYIKVSCSTYGEDREALHQELFGKDSAFRRADGGILFLDRMEVLDGSDQERISSFLETGSLGIGPDGESYSRPILILGCGRDAPKAVLNALNAKVPMKIELPPLSERPLEERLELINRFLSIESSRSVRRIEVNEEVLRMLLLYDCPLNVRQINMDIKIACANAYVRCYQDADAAMTLYPDDFELYVRKGLLYYKQRMEAVNALVKDNFTYVFDSESAEKKYSYFSRTNDMYPRIRTQIHELEERGIEQQEATSIISASLRTTFDNYKHELAGQAINTEQLRILVDERIIRIVKDFLDSCEKSFHRQYQPSVFYGLCLHVNSLLTIRPDRQRIDNSQVAKIIQNFSQEYIAAQELAQTLKTELNLNLGVEEIVIITMFIIEDQEPGTTSRPQLLIVMHGDSTASSVEAVIRSLTKTDNTHSYNLALTTDINEALKELKAKVMSIDQGKGIIAVYDMGSIKTMLETIQEETGIAIRMINIPLTLIGLDAARKCAMDDDVDSVYHSIVTELSQYRSERLDKPGVYITLCNTGEGGARQLSEYIRKYSRLGCATIPLDISDRKALIREVTSIRKTKTVLAFVGTYDPKLFGIPFISIQEVFECPRENIDLLLERRPIPQADPEEQMYDHLEEDLKAIPKGKLREVMPEVIQSFDEAYGLNEDQRIGLAMHLACMVDRLVEHKPVSKNRNAERILRGNAAECQAIARLLKKLEKKFAVIIPDDELANVFEILQK